MRSALGLRRQSDTRADDLGGLDHPRSATSGRIAKRLEDSSGAEYVPPWEARRTLKSRGLGQGDAHLSVQVPSTL